MESHDLTPAKGRAPGFGLIYKALLGRVGRRQARSVAVSYLLDAAELPGMDWTNLRGKLSKCPDAVPAIAEPEER